MLKPYILSALTVASLFVAMHADAATLVIQLDSSIPSSANLTIGYSYFNGTQQQSATMNDFQRSAFIPWLQDFNSEIAKLTTLGPNAKFSLGYMNDGKAINPPTCQAIPLKGTTTIHFAASGCSAF